ncbi:MAG: hypothetical protein ACJAVA_000242 [Flavobacteriaceae bacterium]|jgi:hypothetical protein
MKKQLNLPRIYTSASDKFKKHDGRAKLSYSQHTSWKDIQYKNSYILGYIFKIPQPSNFWAGFGSFCGTSLEYRMDVHKAEGKDKELLDDAFGYFNKKDIETLHKANILFPTNSVYEREIVLDRGSYVIQGFIDVNFTKEVEIDKKKVKQEVVIDVKTGGKDSKTKGTSFYESDKYGQTRLYMKALVEEGETPGHCGVVFLDRIYETERTHPGTTSCFEEPILHLSGEIIKVETPYTEDKVKVLLKDMDKTAEEISSLKSTYDKLSTLTMEF